MARLLGLDGCPTGWVRVALDTRSRALDAAVITSDQIADEAFDLAAIDIPIGLPEHGRRAADIAARRLLGHPRASSVFPAPIRPSIAARTWDQACAITEAVDGRRVPRQAWHILGKIRDVDTLLRRRGGLRERLGEVHPELAFAAWHGAPVRQSKRSPEGRRIRESLVSAHFGAGALGALIGALRGSGAGRDDLVDALGALWSAERLYRGEGACVPHRAELDSAGLPMQICY